MTSIRILALVLLLRGISAAAGNQDSLRNAQADSILYKLDEIVVSASRTEMLRSESPVAAEVFSADRLEQHNAESLSDALSGATGVFIKDYGGSNIKTIALRGMTAENTVVLFDGIRLSGMQNPAVDLGDIPIEMVQRIEVVRSGNSAIVGADAGAGSVNIVFPQSIQRSSLTLHSSFGSFGTTRGGFSFAQTAGSLELHGGAFVERSTGDFPFTLPESPTAYSRLRENNDLHRTNLILSLSSGAGTATSFKTLGWYSESDRGVPDAVVSQTSTDGEARQRDCDLRLLASYGFPLTGAVQCRVSGDFQKTYERYNDPAFIAGSAPLDNYAVNTMGGMSAQFDYSISPTNLLVLGTEIRRYVTGGNELSTTPGRTQQSGYATDELRWLDPFAGVGVIILLPALRYDRFSDVGDRVSPKFALSIRSQAVTGWILKNADMTLRGSVGNNYRVPTFNELYWAGSGNPALRPENSTSSEAGLIYRNEWVAPQSLEITMFNIATTDRIVWVPGDRNLWSPVNIGRVLSRGIELSGTIESADGVYSVRGNYSVMRTTKENSEGVGDPAYKKQLPFIPHELADISFRISPHTMIDWLPKAFLRLEYQFTGYRFTTPDNDPSTLLPPFGIVNIGAGGNVSAGGLTTKVTVSVRNIFDKEYEVMPGYPMPRRNFTVSLSVQY